MGAAFLPYRKLLVPYKVKKIEMPAQFAAAQQRAMAMRNARKARFLVYVCFIRVRVSFFLSSFGLKGIRG
jgi:hypothetical protein